MITKRKSNEKNAQHLAKEAILNLTVCQRTTKTPMSD
jgi:hypothetical protein